MSLPLRAPLVLLLTIALAGCDRPSGSGAIPAPVGAAQAGFDAIVASCTGFLAGRTPAVQQLGAGPWIKLGHSPAQVQHELTRTESAITPYVGKIVVKDNEARAAAASQADAQAITLTPAHLVSNRTHTFIYSFDGRQWRWNNGSRLTKTPGQDDATVALTLADVSAPGQGMAGCLPPP